jgi:dipeptidyl aminopeptidase/acylaminoacyl peptidase
MNKINNLKLIIFVAIIVVAVLISRLYLFNKKNMNTTDNITKSIASNQTLNSLSIAAMRQKSYPGSPITIEQTLADTSYYHQYIVSYLSEGLKINALLTIPIGTKPVNGWPAIIFNHGYIPPEQYKTTERYVAYVDAFAKRGYIVLKSDYRGNGSSQGSPEGAYYSPSYAIDVLNALSSIKKYQDVNPNKIGMWGHSMGGNITLRNLVVNTKDIKAAVIWGGVVGSYDDLLNNWHRSTPFQPSEREIASSRSGKQNFIGKFGTPVQNPGFWNSIDPTFFVSDITAPIQLDVGGSDEEVPPSFSQKLFEKLKNAGKTVEIYSYPGNDHNISQSLSLALERSVNFFDKYLKGGDKI